MTSKSKEPGYLVVINHEEPYSFWPNFKDLPPGVW
ncbi:MAG: MbtH family NRPS accessory protein [Candidatus Methylopumilus sp.]|nr:MbtH family NRPS accessory protein [Candidatus Methylopumilus sp.]